MVQRLFTTLLLLVCLAACKAGEKALQKSLEAAGDLDIDVTGVTPDRIIITPHNQTASAGERVALRATGVYTRDYSKMIATGVAWTSSNPAVFPIDKDGNGLALAEGKSTITATYLGVTSSTKIHVNPPTISQLLVFPNITSMELVLKNGAAVPQDFTRQAFALKTDGSLLDMTDEVDWQIDDGSGLKADPETPGKYTAQAVGNWEMRISYGGFEASQVMVVTQQAKVLKSIRASANPLILRIGQATPLDVIGLFSDDSESIITQEWTLADASDLYSISGKVLTGIKTGSQRTSFRSGTMQTTMDIYVQDPELSSISISPGNFTLHQGETGIYTVLANYGDGTTADITSGATVESTSTAVMSVNTSTNRITGLTQGSANLKASYHNKQVNALVAVDNPVLSRLELRPSALRVVAGRTVTFQVFGIYTNGTEADVTNLATAQALSTSRAEVPTGSPGQLLGKTSGNTALSATYIDPVTQRNLSGSSTVIVDPPEVTALIFDNTTASVPLGRTFDFGIQGTYSDSTQIDVGSLVQITADVTSTGMSYVGSITRTTGNRIRVTTLAQGSMRVIATLGGQTTSATITVTAKQLDAVQIRRQQPYTNAGFMLKGATADFTAVGTFSDSSTLDLTYSTGVFTTTWGAPNAAVASFTDSGDGKKRLTGLNDGDAYFTVSIASVQGNASTSFNIGVYIPCSGTGQLYSYQCWFLGVAGNSCTQTCSAVSRNFHNATVSYVGSGASSNNECSNLLNGIFRSSMTSFNSTASSPQGVGCSIYTQSNLNLGLRESIIATTAAASAPYFRRVCSCE